jgi:hypothetical protein
MASIEFQHPRKFLCKVKSKENLEIIDKFHRYLSDMDTAPEILYAIVQGIDKWLHDENGYEVHSNKVEEITNTPIKYYSKQQATVKCSTYGSEVAGCFAVEFCIEMHNKLCSLGVPVVGSCLLFGVTKVWF